MNYESTDKCITIGVLSNEAHMLFRPDNRLHQIKRLLRDVYISWNVSRPSVGPKMEVRLIYNMARCDTCLRA